MCLQVQELIINKNPTLLDNFLDVSGQQERRGMGVGIREGILVQL